MLREGIHRLEKSYLERLRAAEPAVCEELVQLHWQSVYRQHYLACSSAELAADLTQETFIEIWKSIKGFRGEAGVRTWIHTIAARVWMRHQKRRPQEVSLDRQDELLPEPGPEAMVVARLDHEAVQRALTKLPETQRLSVMLFYREGLSYEDIAEVTGVPVGTVKSRLHEGLKRLRRLLHVKDETR